MYRKFYEQGLLNGKSRLVAIIALTLAFLIPTTATTFAANGANGAPIPSGTVCVEGLVIDWKEEPLESGWIIEARPIGPNGVIRGEPVIAFPSEDDDEKGQFKYADGDLVVDTGKYPHWYFEIKYDGTSLDPLVDGNYDGLVGDWEGVTPTAMSVYFDSDQQDCVRIRFKLREIVSVGVLKIDAEHNPLADWTIVATPAKGNYFAQEQEEVTVSGEYTGTAVFYLTPGQWIFTEKAPEDHEGGFRPVIPQTGRQELEVKSAQDRADDPTTETPIRPGVFFYNGEDVDYVIRFKNDTELAGCIEVSKSDVVEEATGSYPLAGWEISVLRADHSEAAYGYTDATGYIKFANLPFGPYTVMEETRSGWSPVTPDAFDVHLSPDDDGCVQVFFENVQSDPVFVIEGYKLDANEHYGLPGWEISASPLSKNGYEPLNVLTDGTGYYRFELPADDYRVSGAKYEVCEDDEVDGWLPHTPTCYTVMLPKHPGTVKVADFVNQQVGHSESQKPSGSWSGGMWPSMGGNMGPSMGGSMMGGNMGGGMEMKCSKVHKVEKGEGLYEIGAMYMKPAGAMLAANPWVTDRPHNYLYPNDKVCIP
jgi:hypothetical protein